MTEKTLPLLLSEKMFLTASHYNFHYRKPYLNEGDTY